MIVTILIVWLLGSLALFLGIKSRFTLKLRNWAVSHPRRSRRWVIFLMVLNGFLGWELGKRVLDPDLFGKWMLAISLLFVGLIAALYVLGKGRIPMLREVFLHNRMTRGWMAMAAFFLFVQIGNYDQTYGHPIFQGDQTLLASLSPGGDKDKDARVRHFGEGRAEGLPEDLSTLESASSEDVPEAPAELRTYDKNTKETSPRSVRKQLRDARKELRALKRADDGTAAGKAILSVLIIALAAAVWIAVAFLGCAIACSGQGVLGALVLIVGSALVIVLTVVLLMKLWQKSPSSSGDGDGGDDASEEPEEDGIEEDGEGSEEDEED